MSALADTRDYDLTLALVHQPHGLVETVAELWNQSENGFRLILETLYR